MIYENNLDWRDKLLLIAFTHDPFKSAILDYQIQVEGQLEDIIERYPGDPKASKKARMDLLKG